VIAFSGKGAFDAAKLSSNTFEMQWPPRSGRLQSFPEVDRAEWFDIETAKLKVLSGQVDLIDRLAKLGL
jgi:predicted NUDIX family NTP pyrophosphohydrolase